MTRDRVRQLLLRLREFRAGCAPTALAQVERATRSPFHVLVSCVISLRTRDEVTEVASRALLGHAGTPAALAAMPEEQIAQAIYPAGFYRTKARQLRALAAVICHQHGGVVPASEDALLALPGVGRKTANLVLGLAFGVPAICVDTHVHRLANRLDLVRTRTPAATEQALRTVLPREAWVEVNDLLVTFGQHRCHPTSPRCSGCPLDDLCPRRGVTRHR